MPKRGEAPLQRLLDGALRNLDLATRFREHLAVVMWSEVVGRLVAAHSRAETVRDGVLIVVTDTPAWAQELQMRHRELLERLGARVGQGVIRDIHFRSGMRRRARRASAGRPRPAQIALSGRQQRRIRLAVSRIEDEELRGRAERAFTALERMGEWRKRAGWRRCKRCGRWQRVGRRWCSSCLHAGRRRRR